ncbi:PhnD/SsuA/transferrin family substrate-binding protein [Salinicoccus roseus]|uniref:PhnD/SsuA/transferrin family substrate-binding protein n=1 Tax=Salinicoccus roseus TaxID=45670 RepID=A0A0C2DIG4_9STAP|nr:PhnD/SsuA/transferrin family substrate-binding protein [Salinicoccus roseus]KIH69768.1 phosphonate ABC transporter substrate-binding protein [Salinicoccus roseus]MDB0579218.1 PhnD/SsuA/transferrin family substrate-binding protein [Salinicoccus roseus]
MKKWLVGMASLSLLLSACSSDSEGEANAEGKDNSGEPLTMVWYPNESGNELSDARDAIGSIVEEATGQEVEHELTTDYAIAIESLVNDNADLAFTGAEGYVQAKERNDALTPLAVPSGPSGTEEDALYHSWFAALPENMEQYEDGDGEYALDNFEGKKFSFVSPSSTSGFKVPGSTLVGHFSGQEGYEDLEIDQIAENGNVFSEVMFGNSHQGSAVNLLNGKADLAAFCDTCLDNYVEVSEGEENTPGAIYAISEDAAAPFENLAGEEFGILSATPVLNAPFVANGNTLSEEQIKELQDAFTSEEVANNESIFLPEDSEKSGLFTKSADEQFVVVEDAWFDPIRELGQ